MFKVGQKYRILKPFCAGVRLEDELEGLVGTCIDIIGVDDGEAWFHEYDDGRKDWVFAVDVRDGTVELVEEEEDILKQKLDEYNFKISFDNGIGYLVRNDRFSVLINDSGIINIKVKPNGRYINFNKSDLEQLVIALTSVLEDK